jgi:dephospho-CoA kinase
MFKVGFIGAKNTGKTILSHMLSDLTGVPIVSADKIAYEVMKPGTPTFFHIVEAFDEDVIGKNGKLDLRKLEQITFLNDKERKKLNDIVLSAVRKQIIQRFKDYELIKQEYIIYDAPSLFKNNNSDLCDYIICVHSLYELQIARTQTRESIDREEAEAIIGMHTKLEQFLCGHFNFLLRNDKDIEDMHEELSLLGDAIDEYEKTRKKGE